MIIGSWFVSPVFSGSMSTGLYWCIRRFILESSNPLSSGLLALPVFYGVTLFINVLSIVHDGPKCKWLNLKQARITYNLLSCNFVYEMEISKFDFV